MWEMSWVTEGGAAVICLSREQFVALEKDRENRLWWQLGMRFDAGDYVKDSRMDQNELTILLRNLEYLMVQQKGLRKCQTSTTMG